MATLTVRISASGNTATISGVFSGGSSDYSYPKLLYVNIPGYGSVNIYSPQTSGGYNTFSQTIYGLEYNHYYTFSAILYVRDAYGDYIYDGVTWDATYTDSGSFVTEGGSSSATFVAYVNPDSTNGTRAYLSAAFTDGDASYSYQRKVVVNINGTTFEFLSAEVGGSDSTFSGTITGLTAGTTYRWYATLYVRVSGGWSATDYYDSGYVTTSGGSAGDGYVWIYSNGWKQAIPYVYSNGWKRTLPYVYNNGWKRSV